MARQKARKVIKCDCSDGKIIKVYSCLGDLAAELDVSSMTAYYRIRNERPIAGVLYLYEEGYKRKFPVVAEGIDFDNLAAGDKTDKKNDDIKSEPEPVKAESEEDKTEVADKKNDEINEQISEQADKQTSEPATDMVNHPPHYCTGDIECWDAMVSAFGPEWMRAYATVTAFKYIWRAKHKGRFAEDLKKAAWYEARAAELEERICMK